LLNFERNKDRVNVQNSSLARSIMELEDIPIISEDLGGKYMRKLYFDIESGKIYLRKSLRSDELNFHDIGEKE
jgi:chemotaxis receptor (MCP) glutamine deamidase CheD